MNGSNGGLNLQNMVSADAVEDNTDVIRELKHSKLIKDEVDRMFQIKMANLDKSANELNTLLAMECPILFTHYTDIYNRIRKDEIDMGMLYAMIATMQKIEDGEITKSEGAQQMADVIRQLYQMSAIKKAEKLDAAAAAAEAAAEVKSEIDASAKTEANASAKTEANEMTVEDALKANFSWKAYKQTTAYAPAPQISQAFDDERKVQHFLTTSNVGKGKRNKSKYMGEKEATKQRMLHQLREQQLKEKEMEIAYKAYKKSKGIV